MLRTSSNNRAFTIVELLVVIGVIALLVTVIAVGYRRSLDQATEAAMSSDLRAAASRLQTARAESTTNTYPASLEAAGFNNNNPRVSYTYTRSTAPEGFCVRASTTRLSIPDYHVTNLNLNPKAGACP
ncbi:hypothetical protein B7Y94_01405 [Candidatus Saccharibacteria bacterium 32-49-12]|nr:MAG: hypothetical protein B7Y94_01405 [Candidatus Saccharibacteria bacterium 32-49-12]